MSRILVCGVQTLYVRGGAELLVDTLAEQLRARGHTVDLVSLPYTDVPRTQILMSFLAWRALNFRQIHGNAIDLVIGTKFPSYAWRHPNKVVWLTHQHRQAYELYGTRYSDMHSRPDGRFFAWLVRRLDRWSLGGAKGLFTISQNTTDRLKKYNGLNARALYPPPKLAPLLHCEEYGDFLLAVGALSLSALRPHPAGARPDNVRGEVLSRRRRPPTAGAGADVPRSWASATACASWARWDDATLVDLYARCLGVIYPPYDEDYGYVTVEAFLARKPVISTPDAGGVLEFLDDGQTGYVAVSATPEALADAIERLWSDRDRASGLGAAGYQRVQGISWDPVIDALTSTL